MKDQKIRKLEEENKSLEKENKEYRDKIDELKIILIGKPSLQSPQHSLWDQISVEVGKMWDELKKLETEKAYIYLALDKCEVSKEKFQQLHKQPMEKALSAIKILKFPSQDALKTFNIQDGFQIILKAQKIVDKDSSMQKVIAKTEVPQKEIK